MSNLPSPPTEPTPVVVKGLSAGGASSPAPSPSATPRRRGCAPTCLGCGIVAGIVLILAIVLIIVGVFVGGPNAINAVFSGLRNMFVPPAVAVVGDAQTTVIDLAPLAQLVTIRVQLARADVPVQVSGGALNACGFSAYHVVQSTLSAGVDLSLVRAEDIVLNPETDRYTITVPSPQYTSCSVDYSRQYERSFTTCNVDWDAARQLAEFTSMQAMMQETFEGGLLVRAGAEAQSVLSGFVGALTGKPVDVVFDASRQPPFPTSCERRLPDGWTYDAVTNQWQK